MSASDSVFGLGDVTKSFSCGTGAIVVNLWRIEALHRERVATILS